MISSKDVKPLAAYLDVSPQAINQYKIGAAYPKTENLIGIAEYYGISVDYLLGYTHIRNRDTSLQSVNEVTGLSVKAISKLHAIKEKKSSFSDLISALIEDGNAEFFLSLLDTLITFVKSDEGKSLVSVNIDGKELNLMAENHIKAVLQTKLIDNIPEIERLYRLIHERGGVE